MKMEKTLLIIIKIILIFFKRKTGEKQLKIKK